MSSATLQPVRLSPAKTIDGRKPDRDEIPKGDVLCSYCTAKCCRYFALPIETPDSVQDLDFIRWYLLHDRASVFIEDELGIYSFILTANICNRTICVESTKRDHKSVATTRPILASTMTILFTTCTLKRLNKWRSTWRPGLARQT